MVSSPVDDPVVLAALRAIGERVVRSGQLCPYCGRRQVATNSTTGLCYRCESEQEEIERESKRRSKRRRTDAGGQARSSSDDSGQLRPVTDYDDMPTRLLTVTETAEHLGLARSTVYELLKAGDLRSVKLRGARRIPLAAIDDLIRRALDRADS